MSEYVKKRKALSGGEAQTPEENPVEDVAVTQPAQRAIPPIINLTDEAREQLTAVMQELLLKTHELSFEYSTMECDDMRTCPLAKKSKELFRVVKRLNDLVRQFAQTQKAF